MVVFNNSALGLITLEAESVGILPFRSAIEFPNPDFAALARACGGHGYAVRDPKELKTVLKEAFEVDGPAVIDAVVASNELPNSRTSTWRRCRTTRSPRSRKPCTRSSADERVSARAGRPRSVRNTRRRFPD